MSELLVQAYQQGLKQAHYLYQDVINHTNLAIFLAAQIFSNA